MITKLSRVFYVSALWIGALSAGGFTATQEILEAAKREGEVVWYGGGSGEIEL
ncbi:MAG: hypothetical protein HY695_08105 [Deltaproteobacteria bacterium]|nr:hypothetical protein [Deltaproteobacteria bacterium]